MKQKIIGSRFVKWVSSLRIAEKIGENRVLSKVFSYEVIAYVICGFLTTAVNYGVYFLARVFAGIVVSNIIAWIVAVLFAYIVNKIFVFDSPGWDGKTVFRELVPFVTGRLLSLGFDTLFVWLTVGVFGWNEPLFKLLSGFVVLAINYFISKFIVFRKAEEKEA